MNAVVELHERILNDLEQRAAKIEERENEARRALEQILAQCAANRASIAQEKMILSQAQGLYVRFLGGGDPAPPTIVQQPSAAPSASASLENIEVVELTSAAAPPMQEQPGVQTAQPDKSVMEPVIGGQIDELRRNVHESVLLEVKAEEERSARWPGPFKGLLNRN